MAMIVVEMLMQGVYFDSKSAYRLPASRSTIKRAIGSLIKAGVVERSRARAKLLLTDEFLDAIRLEIVKAMPRGVFIHHPDLSAFELCEIGDWSPEELETYIAKLRQRWMLRKGNG